MTTMAIGTMLELTTFLVLPQVLLQGYYVRVMRRTVAGDPKPPAVEDWGTLLVEGSKATVISLVYLAVPIVVFLVTAVPSLVALVGALLEGASAAAGASLGGLVVALAVSAVLFAVFGYAAAAALVAFAHHGRVGAAFSTDLLPVLLSADYLVAHVQVVVVSLAASVVVSVVTAVLAFVPVVNLLLFVVHPFVVKYVWVVWSRLWADAYREVVVARPSPST